MGQIGFVFFLFVFSSFFVCTYKLSCCMSETSRIYHLIKKGGDLGHGQTDASWTDQRGSENANPLSIYTSVANLLLATYVYNNLLANVATRIILNTILR
jgi:hypothetical protein